MAVRVKGAHFPKEMLRTGVHWYGVSPLRTRHGEGRLLERGVQVDHATIARWVITDSSQLGEACHRRTRPVWLSWCMDSTSLRVKGPWYDLYWAVAQTGQTIDVLLTQSRDERTAQRLLTKAIRRHGVPEKITVDGSPAHEAALKSSHAAHGTAIVIRQVPYLKYMVDEVFLTINGKRYTLWRAVAQDEHALDILIQRRRKKQAATQLFRKLRKDWQYVPRVRITDQLQRDGAAKREILPGVEHRQSRSLNNRCANSHRPTRQRERRMQGFKSPGHAQRFLSVYGPIAQHFRPRHHLLSGAAYREEMRNRFASWAEITGTERAA